MTTTRKTNDKARATSFDARCKDLISDISQFVVEYVVIAVQNAIVWCKESQCLFSYVGID
jgi:hypothetical protein